MANNIYDLELNELTQIDDYLWVRRVPGGWVYNEFYTSNDDVRGASVFVPYSEEGRPLRAVKAT